LPGSSCYLDPVLFLIFLDKTIDGINLELYFSLKDSILVSDREVQLQVRLSHQQYADTQ